MARRAAGRRLAPVLALLFALALGGACAGAEEDARAVRALIEENVRALEAEDLERVAATLHDESPARRATLEQLAVIFEAYDLAYDVEVESVRIRGGTAQVSFRQTTRRLAGDAFRDNRLEGVHELRRADGAWKLYATEIRSLDYLGASSAAP